MTVDGVRRSALVYPGTNAAGAPAPLVMSFSPGGSTAANWAAKQGIVAAWPEATFVYPEAAYRSVSRPPVTGPCWQVRPGDLGDRDLHFVDALMAELPKHVQIDPARVYAIGWSCGAWMVFILLYERSSEFAAFVPDDGCYNQFIQWADTPRPVLDFINQGGCATVFPPSLQVTSLRRLDGSGNQAVPWAPGYVSCQPSDPAAPLVYHLDPGPHDWSLSFNAPTIKFLKAQSLQVVSNTAPAEADYSVGQSSVIVAGTGVPGSAGEGVAATSAQLEFPEGVAVDAAGNLYIADSGNQLVRRVSAGGIIRRAAGSGYDTQASPWASAPGSAAVDLFNPTAVNLDGNGNLYLADNVAGFARRITHDGVVSIVGISPAPSGLAVSPAGDLYVADQSRHTVQRIAANGLVTLVAGTGTPGFIGEGGPGEAAQLNFPTGLALDLQGSLYIADTANNRVRRVTPDGTITTVAGTGAPGFSGDGGPAQNAQLNWPTYVAVDSEGVLFIADSFNGRVRRVGTDGVIFTVAGGDLVPAAGVRLHHPAGLAIDRAGNLFVADPPAHMVKVVRGVAAPGLLAGAPFPVGGMAGPVPIGDLNGDGALTVADVTLALRIAQRLIQPTKAQLAVADFDSNETIDRSEAITLLRLVLGTAPPSNP